MADELPIPAGTLPSEVAMVPPEELATVLPLTVEDLDQLGRQARSRGVSELVLLRRALDAYIVPATTRAHESTALEPYVSLAPADRLPAPAHLLAVFAGRLVALRWTALRGRRSIGPGFLSNGRLTITGPGEVHIGRDVNAWARSGRNVLTTYRRGARIVIGDRVRLNGAGIQAATSVEVGDDAILGACTILDTDHHPTDPRNRESGAQVATAPVRIGRNAWVAGAVLLKGVSVGENSIVGLGSVVTSDVPANVMVAGNPARVVRRITE